MTPSYSRDMIGYGPNPPDPQWPDGARLAVNFVLNYEEGSEPSFADGDGQSETGLTESAGQSQGVRGRDRLRFSPRTPSVGCPHHRRVRIRRVLPWVAVGAVLQPR
jgi:hypothetical protein